jgi:hydrogenase maturation protein HypF
MMLEIDERRRMQVIVRGAVQGVGFRLFIYRLACEMGLAGWVSNGGEGVLIEVEGPYHVLEEFLRQIQANPPRASIYQLESHFITSDGLETFEIRQSSQQGQKSTLILPNIATCPHCGPHLELWNGRGEIQAAHAALPPAGSRST